MFTRSHLEEILLLRSELNRLMDDLRQPVLDNTGSWVPSVDCSEDATAYYITVELPGVALDDVEVRVEGETCVIEGIRPPPGSQTDREFRRVERFYGPFKRIILLPDTFDGERVEAALKHGILTVTLPKEEKP